MTERHDGDETVSSSDFRRHIFDISEPVFHVNPPNPQKLFAFQSGDNVRLGLFSAEPIPAANHWAGIHPGEGTGHVRSHTQTKAIFGSLEGRMKLENWRSMNMMYHSVPDICLKKMQNLICSSGSVTTNQELL